MAIDMTMIDTTHLDQVKGYSFVFESVTDEGFFSEEESTRCSSRASITDFFWAPSDRESQVVEKTEVKEETTVLEENESRPVVGFKMPVLLETPIIFPNTFPSAPLDPDFVEKLMSRWN